MSGRYRRRHGPFRQQKEVLREAEALNGGEDVVGRFGPAEGFGIGVVMVDEGGDGGFEGRHAAMDTTSDLAFDQ